MSNPEHVAKLLDGVEAWNAWRKENDEIEPDLEGVTINVNTVYGTSLLQRDLGTGRISVNLCGVNFRKTNLNRAVLSNVNIQEAEFQRASLDYANLRRSYLTNSRFSGASLCGTDLRQCQLWYADFQGASLLAADLSKSDLWCSDLRGACLSNANFESANVAEILFDSRFNQTNFQGIRVSTCFGSQMFKSFAQDQDYLEELRASGGWGRFRFWIWWISADCGRSFVRWGLLSLGMAIAFGIVYYFMGAKHIKPEAPLPFSLITMVYYSVVTFTTLGFGDVKPQTELAASIVMVEVMLGYVMLGGLVSIFANKVARRS